MLKVFTHKYSVTVFENGRFCWRVRGWIPREGRIGALMPLWMLLAAGQLFIRDDWVMAFLMILTGLLFAIMGVLLFFIYLIVSSYTG